MQKIGLLTHSGSQRRWSQDGHTLRGSAARYTREIARKIPSGYEWLALDHEPGREYLSAMQLMGAYARANHDLIHDHFAALQPGWASVTVSGIATTTPGWRTRRHPPQGRHAGRTGHHRAHPGSSGTASYLVRGLGNG